MSSSSITDVTFEWPGLQNVWQALTLQSGYNTSVVIVGATLLGVAASIVGSFTVLRKRALIGDALAHCTLAGLGLAFLFALSFGVHSKNLVILLFGATISGILGVICIQALTTFTRLSEDTAIAVVLSSFFGFGVLLLSLIQNLQTASAAGLHHFIYGQTASMTLRDAYLTAVSSLVAIIGAGLFFKELKLLCFDAQFAASIGWKVQLIDFIMLLLLVIVTVVGLQSVGLILIVALLVIPASAARFWTESFSTLIKISALIGGFSAYLGSVMSSLLPRLPTGAIIVLTSGFFFFVSFLFAPQRGVLSYYLYAFRLRLRVLEEHLLREIYQMLESRPDRANALVLTLHTSALRTLQGLSHFSRYAIIAVLRLRGWLIRDEQSQSFKLSLQGEAEATRVTRNHRLWEEYLLTHTEIDSAHVDRSADFAEHVLSKEIVSKLEDELKQKNRWPLDIGHLKSVHPIGG